MIVETSAPTLFGREREIAVLDDLVDGILERGGALVVRGEAGIGKSALLREASDRASSRGMQVLRTTGVESEAHLPFAGLHQLLRPCLAEIGTLPMPQRSAISAAFGMTDEAAPDVFLIALASLELLGEAAAPSPLVLVVEDAQWLDRPSFDVLTFVGRRLELEPIVLLFAVRDDLDTRFLEAGLPELPLERLGEAGAAALLDAHAPDLAPDVRGRLLDEALGNPLALVELPAALDSAQLGGGALLPDPLPLTARLEWAFAERVSRLPADTRALLLVAAIDEGGGLAEVLSAASMVEGTVMTMNALAPAVAARLVEVDNGGLQFRLPLVRSAISQAASIPQRHAAHAALAEVLTGKSDRAVWHRAASALGADEEIASELEEVAANALRRGAPTLAAAALERAARLTADARRGGLLMRAAEMEFELGHPDLGARLLRDAEPLELGQYERTRMSFLMEMFEQVSWSGAARVASFVEIAEQLTAAGETERAVDALLTVALRCWWGNPDQETRDRVVAAAERIQLPDNHPALIAILAFADPVKRGGAVIERVAQLTPDTTSDPVAMLLLGSAAMAVWADNLSVGFLAAAVEGLRAQGRLGLLAQALVTQAQAGVHLANAIIAMPAAEEANRLAQDTGQPRWAAAAQLARATMAAERGDTVLAESLADEAERVLLPMGANPMLALVQLARGEAALADGRHANAFEHLRRIFDPAAVAYQPLVRAWAISDLAEAAVHSGNDDEARARAEELVPVAAATHAPLLKAELSYARAVLAEGGKAGALFEAALTTDLNKWPCHRGRLLLGYGTWLRRERRVAESRAPLRAAREIFDALGFLPWAERARQELRASGETSRRRTPDARDELTPQELQIAQMAADGLSNREIGQRLYLSHRTVGSHLYRIFPKLGITSRAQLRTVLAGESIAIA